MYNSSQLKMLETSDLEAAQAIVGFEPYRWQQRLLAMFLANEIPSSLDVPTGLGKTVVMGLWLTARALGKPLPRRLVYVVDRRAVVDQATIYAEKIFENVLRSTHPSANRWRSNLGLNADEFPISTLRGQFADNRVWLEDPARSALVVGTVDMIGSRLLFEGYGVGRRMRAVHAAFVGTDSLVVLDEAHLVPPFEALVRRAAEFLRLEPVPGMKILSLSATGRTVDSTTFRLSPDDRKEEPVHKRLNADKRLWLEEAEDLPKQMADAAFDLGKNGSRVVIFCNSREKLAKLIAEDLSGRCKKVWGDECTELLVGARRVIEREGLTRSPVFQRFMKSEDRADSPAFLVATSAGEVGVDLDADHMVCDLVAWERMVQRLGRVNRSGRLTAASIRVFVGLPKDRKDLEDATDDRLAILRAPFQSSSWRPDPEGYLQAGPVKLSDLKSIPEFAAVAAAATTPPPLRPELKPALLDAWAMTSLKNHPGRPVVEPWIRGWVKQDAQTRVLWRAMLPMQGERPDKQILTEFFAAFPPHLTEVLEAETYLVLGALRERAKARQKAATSEEDLIGRLAVVVLDSEGEVEEWLSLAQLAEREERGLSGRTLVVDARLGGLTPDGLLDSKSADPVITLDTPGQTLWGDDLMRRMGRCARRVPVDADPLAGWVREAGWPVNPDDDGEAREEWRVERFREPRPAAETAVAARKQSLAQHSEWVAQEVDRIAENLGLPHSYKSMLRICARRHDDGKSRDIWQNAMGADTVGRPYAKTTGKRTNPAALGGYRHEFGSYLDARAELDSIEDIGLRDLAAHLILAHHGFARPLIEPIDSGLPPTMARSHAIAAANQFVQLQNHWGVWGLAWWEALLRCADWAASERAARAEEEVL